MRLNSFLYFGSTKETFMKNYYYLIFITLFCITGVYAQNWTKNWHKVYEYELKGQTKSANEVVEKIYKQAVKRKNNDQRIKAFIYRLKFIKTLDKEENRKIILSLREEIKTAEAERKAILYYLYGKCLFDYYTVNYYQIYRNKKTIIPTDDFTLWVYEDFEMEFDRIYQNLFSEEMLTGIGSVSIANYPSLINFGDKFIDPQEKLISFLAYQWLENIRYNSKHGWRSTGTYSLDKTMTEKVLAPNKTFLKEDFSENQTWGNKLFLIQLIERYAKSGTQEQIAISEYRRFRILNMLFSLEESVYIQTLENFRTKYAAYDIKTDAEVELIDRYNNHKPDHLSQSESKQRALELIDSFDKAKSYNTLYVSNLEKMQQLIKEEILSIKVKGQLYENQNHRLLLEYKNVYEVETAYYRVPENFIIGKDSVVSAYIKDHLPEKRFVTSLKNTEKYALNSTEIIQPALLKGNYLVVVKSTSLKDTLDFNAKNSDYTLLNVSNITVQQMQQEKETILYISDAKTGKPLKGAIVQIADIQLIADSIGKVVYLQDKDTETTNRNTGTVAYEGDVKTFYVGSNYYRDSAELTDVQQVETRLFLDRGIYRPGQTVYFKAVSVINRADGKKVFANQKWNVFLKDANRQIIEEREMISNEWGSLHGEFILPQNVLTGRFSIEVEAAEEDNEQSEAEEYEINNQEVFFSVEEYKRPTFEVGIEPVAENVRINSEAIIKGTVKSFSGGSITDATIQYTVKRVRFSRDRGRSYQEFYAGVDSDEFHAETKTDTDGNFEIKIATTAFDGEIVTELPVYEYKINVAATDKSGETRENSFSFQVTDAEINLQLKSIEDVTTGQPLQLPVSTEGYNGNFIPTEGILKVYAKEIHHKFFSERLWSSPTEQHIPKEEFENLFPYEPYTVSSDEWEKEKLMFEKPVKTNKEGTVVIDDIENWPTGYYEYEFSYFDQGAQQQLSLKKDFSLKNRNDTINVSDELTLYIDNEKTIAKDGYIALKMITPFSSLYVNTQAFTKSGSFFEDVQKLDKHQIRLKIPVHKVRENRITIQVFFVYEGRLYQQQISYQKPKVSEELNPEIIHLRQKLYPGAAEEWKIKFTQAHKKPVSAEVLATMYDSSLDDFSQSFWNYDNSFSNDYFDLQRVDSRSDSYRVKTGYRYNRSYQYLRLNLEQKWFSLLHTFGFDFNTNENTRDYNYFLQTYKLRYEFEKKLNRKQKELYDQRQSIIVHGKVVSMDYEEILRKAIILDGSRKVIATTDENGNFIIRAKPGDIIRVTFPGFIEATEVIGFSDAVKVYLIEDDGAYLESIIVDLSPRSTKPKSSRVSTNTENKQNTTFAKALEAKVAGIHIATERYTDDNSIVVLRGVGGINKTAAPLFIVDGVPVTEEKFKMMSADIANIQVLKEAEATAVYGNRGANGAIIITTKKALNELQAVPLRKNVKETAFFLPNLYTDKEGNISVKFTSPEALTAWRFRVLAHDKKGVFGYTEQKVITQKELMIQPNMPRFVRETDTIVLKARVSNMSDKAKKGMALLQLFDATTMKSIDKEVIKSVQTPAFDLLPGGSASVSWTLVIPKGLQGIQYQIAAKSEKFTDGEESILPVLTNRMLLTESQPVWINAQSKKEFSFEHLQNSVSTSHTNQSFIIEYTNNPIWLAIQSLPYLMEFEHECSEQLFARYYANTLATSIINSNEKLKALFDKWSSYPVSKLRENEALKSISLAETPWISDAMTEEEKRKNLSLLFDLQTMKKAHNTAVTKLSERQLPSGGFAWFESKTPNTFITTHIVSGIGHLKKLKAFDSDNIELTTIAEKAVDFIDNAFIESNKRQAEVSVLPKEKCSYADVAYLYARSFFEDKSKSDALEKIIAVKLSQLKKDWISLSLYQKAQAVLVLNRANENPTAIKILTNLKETAVQNNETGMFWNENKRGRGWYETPIETQALLIEAFSEVDSEDKDIEKMKTWLIANKKAVSWGSTKATTEAIYALLLQGSGFSTIKDKATLTIGGERIVTDKLEKTLQEQETGTIRLQWTKDEINKNFGKINIHNKSEHFGFGGIYWQYFEDLDKVASHQLQETVQLEKKLFVKKITGDKEILKEVGASDVLKIGDLVTVHIRLNILEDMDFVHLKDLRASCFEPKDVLSEMVYNNGLAYYKSTKDAATHFFFDHISKGTYIIEYQLRVSNQGKFANGITTLESMYAPEFSIHTEGTRINVE